MAANNMKALSQQITNHQGHAHSFQSTLEEVVNRENSQVFHFERSEKYLNL